jgi:hypothetical protein
MVCQGIDVDSASETTTPDDEFRRLFRFFGVDTDSMDSLGFEDACGRDVS